MKKWLRVMGVVVLLVGGTVLYFWPRNYQCQRCGAGVRKCGPFIVAQHQHYIIGAAGDVGLYCERNGHILVEEYDHEVHITDWRYHRDSFKTQEAYRRAKSAKNNPETFDDSVDGVSPAFQPRKDP